MAAQILDGRAAAKELKAKLKQEFASLKEQGHDAHVVSLSVGSDGSSDSYVRMQAKQAERIGVKYTAERIPADSTVEQVEGKIKEICDDPTITGLILQLPLPGHLNANDLAKSIDPLKNIEGVDPINLGRIIMRPMGLVPCTARASVDLALRSGVDFRGKHAVVIGRSIIVGRPTAMLLLNENCTVTVCHRYTPDVKYHTQQADIVVSAVGVEIGMVKKDWIKPGAIVVDVATIYQDGKTYGDVAFDEVSEVAGWISPVPGGVGPLTVQMLFQNALDALKLQLAAK